MVAREHAVQGLFLDKTMQYAVFPAQSQDFIRGLSAAAPPDVDHAHQLRGSGQLLQHGLDAGDQVIGEIRAPGSGGLVAVFTHILHNTLTFLRICLLK